MNKETARNLLMDFLYGEISDADQEKLEAYLEDHPELQKEREELWKTRLTLKQMPQPEAQPKIAIVETGKRSWPQNLRGLMPQSGWGKAAFATAACLLLLLVGTSIANLSIQSTQHGFSINFGYADRSEPVGLTQAQTDAIVQQIQQDNAAILTEYADMLNKHNSQQLQQVVKYFERQRLNDLQVIDQAFNQYQAQTDNKLQQTNQVLGEVLQTVAANDQQ